MKLNRCSDIGEWRSSEGVSSVLRISEIISLEFPTVYFRFSLGFHSLQSFVIPIVPNLFKLYREWVKILDIGNSECDDRKKNCLNLLEIWLLEGDFVINAFDVL